MSRGGYDIAALEQAESRGPTGQRLSHMQSGCLPLDSDRPRRQESRRCSPELH